MWAFLLALFGGVAIAVRAALENNKRQEQQIKFEMGQERLRIFRSLVTKPSVENLVQGLIYNAYETGNTTPISNELESVFSKIQGLSGLGDKWFLHNSRPPASNIDFVTLVLCINRGCVPVCAQWNFRIWPYFIGMEYGHRKYSGVTDAGMYQFSDWAVSRLRDFNIDIELCVSIAPGDRQLTWR